MSRAVRWTIAGVAALVTFGLGVTLVRALPWGWLPQEDGARLDTALAFGAVAATVVLAGLGWWAGREQPPPAPVPPAPPRTVTQTATASDDAQVTQTGGGAPRVEQHAEASGEASVTQTGGHLPARGQGAPAPAGDLPDEVVQRAEASGRGRIVQSGGDQHVDGV
ncbi:MULTISPECIES: hypothetical protein [Streptomyces]|uniref:Uncharacterized protein n=2 Tax=Streptomyces TaxID=1883 RepID=A0ABU4KEH3_9ACTN|nr:hypothetical protein [Streptomyces roseolus]MDX2296163.1 hypothetical protein [Streptomyces roseolus]